MIKDCETINVYVDTCVLSRLLQQNIKEEQLNSLDKICSYDFINFVTSPRTLEELNRTKDNNTKVTLKVFYKLMNKIPNAERIIFEGGLKLPLKFPMSFGTAKEDEIFLKLKKIFKDGDEIHIFNAIKSNCKYFMTLDFRTILDKVKKNKALEILKEITTDLDFVSPKELLDKIIK